MVPEKSFERKANYRFALGANQDYLSLTEHKHLSSIKSHSSSDGSNQFIHPLLKPSIHLIIH